jgi:DNA-binding response OmpR family regulator
MHSEQILAGYRILVIEDEYFIARELQALLQTKGAEVVGPLGSVDQAMEQVKRDGFEVAVLDINLQGAEGYPIADELRRRGVSFVFASAYSEDPIPLRFADVHLWQKPYSELALVEDIRRLCERQQLGHQTISSAQPLSE